MKGLAMAAATKKTILTSTTRHDKKVYTHPVAVFANPTDAKTYATFIRLALRSNDKDAMIALDAQTVLDADGNIAPDVKWSLVTVPYAPSPDFGDDDDAAAEDSSTS